MKKITVLILIFSALLINNSFAQVKNVNMFTLPKTIQITGDPATPAHVKRVLKLHLQRAGYNPEVLDRMKFDYISRGKTATLEIPLQKSENAEKVSTKQIKIENLVIPAITPKFLAFSNHPEKVKKPGVLFEAGLINNKPIRLRSYHLGEENSPTHYFGVYLVNRSNRPARVRVVEAVGGPSENWMMAGHMNNLKFMHRLEKELGRIEEIPARSVFPIYQTSLEPGKVISATQNFFLIEGSPLQLVVYASQTPDEEIPYPIQSDVKDRHARGAYPLTAINIEAAYSLCEDSTFYTIGDTRLKDIFKGRDIRGNYGIIYDYDFTLCNPFKEEKKVGIFFQPRGGIATGSFSIDGHMVSVGTTRAYEVVQLTEITLPAESERKINLETMPEDASNYPVRLILMPIIEENQ